MVYRSGVARARAVSTVPGLTARSAADRGSWKIGDTADVSTGAIIIFVGACFSLLGAFGFVPVEDRERQAERESWNLRRPMAQQDRMFRQRGYLLYRARWVLAGAGGSLVAIGVVIMIA